ncbi:LPO_1073/Vpar_1526 family protein [Sphingomonas sp. CFBP 8760]|uniref:LPO_1073/Vpar_1526 family protein n=1 Tax=Sphingomonas sp. CFBP 8760 TaxID=2775282 RepID=UPI0017846C61|nr:LPO_1073/Vpar_1526 family protein [Sphingomonas sp. CFBP 8760]MBD8546959.1 hypothetical protein [Sphingomonas sp. CFBP 8760]
MSDRQDQKVAAGGTAIQSLGDTTIYNGVGSDEIKAIVEGLADQLPRMAAVASAIVEERLKSFKEEVIGRFDKDGSVKGAAFEDPDFIEVVAEAQRGYARTGKADAHKTLIDLIAERSKQTSGERIAHVLNEAVSVTPRLTSSELSELALVFAIKSIRLGAINSLESFAAYHQLLFDDLLGDVETGQGTYNYLVAQRCASISMGEISLIECWRRTYPGLFMVGLDRSRYHELVGDAVDNANLFTTSLLTREGLQVNAVDKNTFDALAAANRIESERAGKIWDQAINNLGSDNQIISRLSALCPSLADAHTKWNGSPLKNLDLTALGLAIGHTRMSQIPAAVSADISIWIN